MASTVPLLLLQTIFGAPISNSISSVGGSSSPAVTPTALTSLGYSPAPPNHSAPTSLSNAASAEHVAQVARVTNELMQGKLNITATVTLTPNADSTTITDARISASNAVVLVPVTASAATEAGAGTVYVSLQTNGSAVIAHANNATADRTFTILILG